MEHQSEFFPFKGYEGLYEWSQQLERVRGLKSGIVLKWRYDHSGRPYVQLSKDGVKRCFYKAMIIYSHVNQCEIPLGFDVHHIDFNKENNDQSNLQLLTREEHMKIHGKNEKAVVALDEKGNVVHRFSSVMEAKRNGFNQGHVSEACRGCYSTHKGHYYKGLYWYYEEEWLAHKQQLAEPTIQVDAYGQFYFCVD